jgi:hypothetical protein
MFSVHRGKCWDGPKNKQRLITFVRTTSSLQFEHLNDILMTNMNYEASRNYWAFGLRPSTGIKKTQFHLLLYISGNLVSHSEDGRQGAEENF